MANGTKDDAKRNGLAGLRVLCLESRRGKEMAKLIANYGGETVAAPLPCSTSCLGTMDEAFGDAGFTAI